ncbi:MAG: DUF2147 domain-containing protein [Pseudomonadota bacterium]
MEQSALPPRRRAFAGAAIAVGGALAAFGAPSSAAAAPPPGVYNTGASDAVEDIPSTLDFAFHPCADEADRVCASVVRVVDPEPDQPETMPDGQPIVGFTFITGLKDKGDGEYRGGRVNAIDESLDKDKMVWYGVKVDLQEDGSLKAKGCLAFICPRTVYWKRVSDGAE